MIQLLQRTVVGVVNVMTTPVIPASVMLHMLGTSANTVPVASMQFPRKYNVMYMFMLMCVCVHMQAKP